MTWTSSQFIDRLEAALQLYDRAEAAKLCNEVIAEIKNGQELEEEATRRILQSLRRKCYFELMERVAEAFLLDGIDAPHIRRQFAQSLIEQGKLAPAISVLEALIDRSAGDPEEISEARGLLGRIHKHVYVNAANSPSRRKWASLQKAIAAYEAVYLSAPDKHLWHGINTVALTWRARRDLVTIDSGTDPVKLARDILKRIDARASGGRLDTWDLATAAEASIALGKTDEAKRWLEEYVHRDDADAFEIGSTLRQLRELWLLTVASEPGSTLLPFLEAHLLQRTGGRIDAEASDVHQAIQSAVELEKTLCPRGVVTLRWYRHGLERCRLVAQVRSRTGEAYGTGFLVRGTDLAPGLGDELLFLTNAHVVTDDPDVKEALRPDEAEIVFEAQEKPSPHEYRAARLIWTSPPGDLDTSVLRLEPAANDSQSCPLAPRLPLKDGAQKVYIIGHPGGRGLSVSLYDNLLLDYDDRLLHYRTPTEGGSSGSPVFNNNWALIGIHHGGSWEMRKLNGKGGTYAANEGIQLQRIRERINAATRPS
jgi:tetratricopeptide (TPR) repeat protein